MVSVRSFVESSAFLFAACCLVTSTTSFRCPPPALVRGSTSSSSSLDMAGKKKKKKKSGGGGGGVGIKGFGGGGDPSDGGGGGGATIDRSREALALYDYLERVGAGSNLKRVGLGRFPLGDDGTTTIRGVVALRPIKKGEVIIGVPYEAALNLGAEGSDPTLPASSLLERVCGAASSTDAPYLDTLPAYDDDDDDGKGPYDHLGSTDFFSDEALEELQFPTVRDETLRRRADAASRSAADAASREADGAPPLAWRDGATPVAARHLAWAAWLVTSRVLTVQGPADDLRGVGAAFRLMIPLVDMCNHDRDSVHVLTGRAEPGGTLKVVAGSAVEAGEQINICYGGGVAGNDRFLQDYGFLDWNPAAYDIVAKQLLGTTRAAEKRTTAAERETVLRTLETTTVEDDEARLAAGGLPEDVRTAVEFRIGVKKALARARTD